MFKIFRHLKWFFRDNWIQYVISFVLGIGVSFFLLVAPDIMARIFNAIENNTLTLPLIILLIVINILAVLMIYLTAAWRRVVISRLSAKLSLALRERYLAKILTLDRRFFHRFSTGDLLTRSQGDIDMVVHTGVDMILTFVMQIIGLSLFIVNMVAIHPQLTLQIMIPLPLLWITLYVMTPVLTKNWIRVRDQMARMTESALESVKNVRIIRAFTMERRDFNKNKTRVNEVYAMEKRTLRINALYHPLFEAIATGVVLLSLWLGGQYVLRGEIEIGSLLQFHIYAGSLMWPFVDLGHIFSTLNQSNASFDRILEILEAKSSLPNDGATVHVTTVNSIKVTHLNFAYPDEKVLALKDINFSITRGQTIGIVGKTGSGKSTLLNQLLRLYPTPHGAIQVNNHDLMTINPSSFYHLIGYVPQEHALFSLSVDENIRLGASNDVSAEQLHNAIVYADFAKDVAQLQDGMNTLIGEHGSALSGGQRQRLSIARALVQNPEILILDDAFSAVDGTTEATIIDWLKKIRAHKTTIIVTHRLSAIQHADQILVMNNGAIQSSGTHDELLARDTYYKSLYEVQQFGGHEHE